MRGRFIRTSARREYAEAFGLPELDDPRAYQGGDLAKSWSVTPFQRTRIIRDHSEGSPPTRFDMARWGLLPKGFTGEPSKVTTPIETPIDLEAESVAAEPQFTSLFRFQRCVVPVDGYFEWRTLGEKLYPWFIRLSGGAPMALAGIWDSSLAPGKTTRKLSFCVLTTAANRQLAVIQRRMPVILDRDRIAAWLDRKVISSRAAAGMICSYPAERMEAWPVSTRVNNIRSNDAELIEPVK